MSISDDLIFSDEAVPSYSKCSPELGQERSATYSLNNWETRFKVAALKIASYLTQPICKVREYFYTFYILDETSKTTTQKIKKVVFLTLGIAIFTLLMPFFTLLGAAVRALVVNLGSKPYIYLQGAGEGKILPKDKMITLVSHNQCYMPAGYAITDGQVTPTSQERIDVNIKMIKKLNPDLICLYEVPDICDAAYISSGLLEYPFMIPVAGIKAVGPSSMMYIASKYEIVKDSIEFVPFVKGSELTGRAQYSEKGFLSFDVKSAGEKAPFATVVSSHLQHSEIPAKPVDADRRARSLQMNKIMKQIQKKVEQGKPVIFTGDLNQEEDELNTFLSQSQIDWLKRDLSICGKATWGGDQWCAELMGKTFSNPLVLDYTFIAGKADAILTQIIETGYSGQTFRPEASSDHALLFSTVIFSEDESRSNTN